MRIASSGLMVFCLALAGCESISEMTESRSSSSGIVIGDSCEDSDQLCLGVKYVVYRRGTAAAVADHATAIRNIRTSNEIWSKCGIAFQIEKFEEVDPATEGLAYSGSASANQTYTIRRTFEDDLTFLVVTTGPWGTTKNAWTATPGTGSYGVVMEASVAGNGNILAHELGHYLNLDHVGTTSNVMSTIIYPSSKSLTESQCSIARRAISTYWDRMLR